MSSANQISAKQIEKNRERLISLFLNDKTVVHDKFNVDTVMCVCCSETYLKCPVCNQLFCNNDDGLSEITEHIGDHELLKYMEDKRIPHPERYGLELKDKNGKWKLIPPGGAHHEC